MPYCVACGKELSKDMTYCPYCGERVGTKKEEFSVSADDLAKKIKDLIKEANVTRIIVKNEEGTTILEVPATIGAVGTILAPWMAAIGVIAAMVTRCTIVVERRE